jgi:hypothetical protein
MPGTNKVLRVIDDDNERTKKSSLEVNPIDSCVSHWWSLVMKADSSKTLESITSWHGRLSENISLHLLRVKISNFIRFTSYLTILHYVLLFCFDAPVKWATKKTRQLRNISQLKKKRIRPIGKSYVSYYISKPWAFLVSLGKLYYFALEQIK